MVLAAGRGERMRPLTDSTPKPLLQVRGKPLMQWPLEALARGGFTSVVVNTAWLGEQISHTFGSHFALQPPSNERHQLSNTEQTEITYSHEGQDFGGALETAGGIVRALPTLGDVFWVLAGDVFAPDFVFSQDAVDRFIASGQLAHLWLVPNPSHNRRGDFGLSVKPGDDAAVGLALNLAPDDRQTRYTYSTIGLYRRQLFAAPYCDIPAGNPQGLKAPLAPLLRAAMDNGRISAELYSGAWTDVGTPERLQSLNQ
ncbi:nucleotidyltransferase family protein [Rhodoferax sp. UBA5149]|uniref:nucleotidyltransferase family protein n=1 Tax=Rhodoferax sp. UBA5149 TaxID=1947379 RepID=UPI0025CCABB2|nr:nucleotidyltransferase family protein [Rhodoferax sp. UBA5149]